MAESAKDKLIQASAIQDARLREAALLGIISSATDAKRVLMRNFNHNMKYIESHSGKSRAQMIADSKGQRGIDAKASDAFQALIFIVNIVQTECKGYALLSVCFENNPLQTLFNDESDTNIVRIIIVSLDKGYAA